MQWEFIVALAIVIPLILFPAAFIWYLNIGELHAAIKERRIFSALGHKIVNTLAILVPLGIYAVSVWYFFGHFGWAVALALSLVMPVVMLVPVLVWATIVSGLSQVVRDSIRRRITVPRRRVAGTVAEPVLRKVA